MREAHDAIDAERLAHAFDQPGTQALEVEIATLQLPDGVRLIPTYDRSELIKRAIDTLTRTLIEESLIVAAVCIVFLLHVRSALVALQEQFRSRETGKTYAALVNGAWPVSKKVIDVPLHKFLTAEGERRVRTVDTDHDEGRRSITLVKVMTRFRDFSLLDVTIKTGRTHQIRVHLAHEGHPIAGDEKYGDFALNKALAKGDAVKGQRFERMFLHARRLRFQLTEIGESIYLIAPLTSVCVGFLKSLIAAE